MNQLCLMWLCRLFLGRALYVRFAGNASMPRGANAWVTAAGRESPDLVHQGLLSGERRRNKEELEKYVNNWISARMNFERLKKLEGDGKNGANHAPFADPQSIERIALRHLLLVS